MATMTSQTDASNPTNEAQRTGGTEGTMSKAAHGAASLATKGVRQARERMDDRISQQRERISSRVRGLSRALRGASDVLEEDEITSQVLQYASEKVERVAGYVADLTPNRVADDLRSVAHKQPVWFFGSAFVLGLALGRFARSTGGAMMEGGGTEEGSRGWEGYAPTSEPETRAGTSVQTAPVRTVSGDGGNRPANQQRPAEQAGVPGRPPRKPGEVEP